MMVGERIMRLVSVLILVGLVISNPVKAEDKVYGKGVEKCSTYLGVYGSFSITSGQKYTVSLEGHKFFNFIDGYRSAHPTKRRLGSIEGYRWLASWCRDNPNQYFLRGIDQLVKRF
jgi:hypothetical protein